MSASARFRQRRIRSAGKLSSRSVSTPSRTFFSAGTGTADHEQVVCVIEGRQHRPMEERRGVHDDDVVRRACSKEPVDLVVGDLLAVLGRSGAASTSSPDAECRVTQPRNFSASSSPPAIASSWSVCSGWIPSMIEASPNWTSRSTSSVRRRSFFAMLAARFTEMTVAVPPLGEKTVMTCARHGRR